jgi:hypothetical protein
MLIELMIGKSERFLSSKISNTQNTLITLNKPNMNIISKFSILLFWSIALSSCSISNKDYVGEYKTQFTVTVKAENTQSFFASKGMVEFPTGFNVVDLGTINISFVINESTNTLTGTGKLNIPIVQPMGYSNLKKRETISFDVIAPNIKNDTLFFSIQPLSTNNRMDSYLIKEGKKVYLGIDKNFCSNKANGPQFVKTNGKYNQYNTNDPELFKKFDEFIIAEFKHNDSLIVNPTIADKEKSMLINANNYLNEMYGTATFTWTLS